MERAWSRSLVKFVPMALLIDLHQVYEKSIEVGHRLEVLAQVYGKSMFKDLNSPVVIMI